MFGRSHVFEKSHVLGGVTCCESHVLGFASLLYIRGGSTFENGHAC